MEGEELSSLGLGDVAMTIDPGDLEGVAALVEGDSAPVDTDSLSGVDVSAVVANIGSTTVDDIAGAAIGSTTVDDIAGATEDVDGSKEEAPAHDITITINAKGEVNIDQTALSQVLNSSQKSARVTFVRVGEQGVTVENQVDLDASELIQAMGGDPSMNPMMMLDQDQMSKLESVLQSDEAKNFLDEAYHHEIPSQENEGTEDDDTKTPTRRSQRSAVHRKPASPSVPSTPTTPRTPNIRGRGRGGMRGGGMGRGRGTPGSGNRPQRTRKLPAHLNDDQFESPLSKGGLKGEKEKKGKNEDSPDQENQDVEASSDEDDGADSWASEDDPDRVWCICKQPHNNRFMICCDICLDWFHGKCVGITKAKGKDMEEAGQDWTCPQCINQENKADEPEETGPAEEDIMETTHSNTGVQPSKDAASSSSSSGRRNSAGHHKNRRKSSIDNIVPLKEKKGPTCHMCNNPPRDSSIYCSEDCIKAHASQALKQLQKSDSSRSNNTVVVLEPKTNTLLNGPNAPTKASLQDWLVEHKSYHVVMSTALSSEKFYHNSKHKHRRHSGEHTSTDHEKALHKEKLARINSKAKQIFSSVFNRDRDRDKFKTKEEIQAEVKAQLHRAALASGQTPSKSKRERKNSESRSVKRQHSVSKAREHTSDVSTITPPKPPPDNKSLRRIVIKGVRDALKEKLEKAKDLEITQEKVQKIAEEIEIAMFGTFGDLGAKYKNKYRSLTYNIKDPKNDGLFRRILLRDLSPIEVAGMTADEYASKELQEWRQKEAKKDIEAIKDYEKELLALGNTYVMKSHKGEQVIEKDDDKQTTIDIKLPDEIPEVKAGADIGKRTLDHPNHGDAKVDPLCDVCTGKITLEELVTIKMKKTPEKDSSKDSHRRSSSRKHKSHHKSSRHSSSSSSSTHKSRSSSRQKHTSSSSSSSRHKHTSADKHRDKESSGKSKDSHHSSTHNKSKSDETKESVEKRKDLQDKIDKATAAIEEAKRSGEEFNKTIGDKLGIDIEYQSPEPMPRGNSPDLGSDSEGTGALHSEPEQEVTSTVTIPTPDSIRDDQDEGEGGDNWVEEDVWKGHVIMPDVAKFNSKAFKTSGEGDHMMYDLGHSLEIVGRIPPNHVWDYIQKIKLNVAKEIVTIRLEPVKGFEAEYQKLYSYLATRNRFAVVGSSNKKTVKDCYIFHLSAGDDLPKDLLPVVGPGLPAHHRKDSLLCLIIRTRRKRAGDSAVLPGAPQQKHQKTHHHGHQHQVEESTVPQLVQQISQSKPESVQKTSPRDAISPYNPEEEPYDPGEGDYGADIVPAGVPAGAGNVSMEEDGNASPGVAQIVSSDAGGFTEQLRKLQEEVDNKKAELARRMAAREQFSTPPPPPIIGAIQPFGLPDTSAPPPLMPGVGSPLVPLVASRDPRALPTPGRGMPGNRMDEGVRNLEAAGSNFVGSRSHGFDEESHHGHHEGQHGHNDGHHEGHHGHNEGHHGHHKGRHGHQKGNEGHHGHHKGHESHHSHHKGHRDAHHHHGHRDEDQGHGHGGRRFARGGDRGGRVNKGSNWEDESWDSGRKSADGRRSGEGWRSQDSGRRSRERDHDRMSQDQDRRSQDDMRSHISDRSSKSRSHSRTAEIATEDWSDDDIISLDQGMEDDNSKRKEDDNLKRLEDDVQDISDTEMDDEVEMIPLNIPKSKQDRVVSPGTSPVSATPSPTEGLSGGGGDSPYDPELMDLEGDDKHQDTDTIHKNITDELKNFDEKFPNIGRSDGTPTMDE